MLFHLSFCSREPERVGRVLAEILGAQVVRAPSPPFNEGALFVCCGDDRGTMISLEPWGVTYRPGPHQMTAMPRESASPEHSAATFDAEGVKKLDAQNRALEGEIRSMMAASAAPEARR